jgi:DNA polymerase-1
MNQKPLLILVDGPALFHRGYHAIPHLSNSKGEPTNAVYGFATILFKVLADLKPQYCVVAWDKSSDTFRKDMYPEYKATRVKQPEDLYAQMPVTKELVKRLGLPLVEVDKFEGDDIIGTLARKAEARGDLDVVIVTGDKDQLQLVDRNIVVDMFNPRGMEPTRYDLAKVKERYGLTPAQFIDYKALVGDPSDNIPGVKGIGDKGAQKLLGDYGSLQGIYDHLDEITGKVHEYLENNREMAFLSRELSTIVTDMPLELDLEGSVVGKYDRESVHELFSQLEFRGAMLSKLPGLRGAESSAADAPSVAKGVPAVAGPANPAAQSLFGDAPLGRTADRSHLKNVVYEAVTTEAALTALVVKLEAAPVFALDTETTSTDALGAELVGLSVCVEEGHAYYIPVAHVEGGHLNREAVLDALRPILENKAVGKTGHNIKYDYEVLKRHGVTVRGIVFDSMVAAFLLNSLGRSQSLDDLAYAEFGIEMIPIHELIGTGKNQITFDRVDVQTAAQYAAEDADMSWRLYQRLNARLDEFAAPNEHGWSMKRLADEIEWPIITVLAEMELAGITLNSQFLHDLGGQLSEQIGKLKEHIYKAAGEEFNLNSPSQLGQILYGRLGLSTAGLKRGKTGVSTAAGELEKMRGKHPIIELIMQFRELDKLMSTYVGALPGLVKADGRVHTSFNQTITQTGRLSSNNPNLQNIPVRTEVGRSIRKAFVAPPGRVLVSADYSQIELRVAAALSGDEAMIRTFKEGYDLHLATAAELYGIAMEEVTKSQRANVKAINFGVLYGQGAHGLSQATGMSNKEAAEFINRYFAVRPKLLEYIEAVKAFAHANNYVETYFGRRRACPEVNSSNFNIRAGAERMAVNVPIQGTAADIYKLAMIAVVEKLPAGCELLLQIHDELMVECPAERGEEIAKMMKEIMEGVIDLGLPLSVDTEIGQNWGEL